MQHPFKPNTVSRLISSFFFFFFQVSPIQYPMLLCVYGEDKKNLAATLDTTVAHRGKTQINVRCKHKNFPQDKKIFRKTQQYLTGHLNILRTQKVFLKTTIFRKTQQSFANTTIFCKAQQSFAKHNNLLQNTTTLNGALETLTCHVTKRPRDLAHGIFGTYSAACFVKTVVLG